MDDIILPPHVEIVELSDGNSSSDSDDDEYTIEISENVLEVYVDIVIATEDFVEKTISTKKKFNPTFINTLSSHIDTATIIIHSLPYNDELRYDLGVVIQDLKTQKFKIEQYMFHSKRMNAEQQAKIEAYQDPEIACYSELSKNGLKTRNRFYKR